LTKYVEQFEIGQPGASGMPGRPGIDGPKGAPGAPGHIIVIPSPIHTVHDPQSFVDAMKDIINSYSHILKGQQGAVGRPGLPGIMVIKFISS
ncbi:unnamed protein product, partial [Rotaria magnacalcarata]